MIKAHPGHTRLSFITHSAILALWVFLYLCFAGGRDLEPVPYEGLNLEEGYVADY